VQQPELDNVKGIQLCTCVCVCVCVCGVSERERERERAAKSHFSRGVLLSFRKGDWIRGLVGALELP